MSRRAVYHDLIAEQADLGVGQDANGFVFAQPARESHSEFGFAGGRIQGGRVLDYKEKPDRQMCRLYLTMLDKLNVRLPKFGDATKPLEEV